MALQIHLPRTTLSRVSLSLEDVDTTPRMETRYRRKGYMVRRMLLPRQDRRQKYPVCLIPPVKGWYPSLTANFIFGTNDRDPRWYLRFAPARFNPSIWSSARHPGCPVLRVPKDRDEEMWKRLYANNFWFHGAKNLWFKRKRRRTRRAA